MSVTMRSLACMFCAKQKIKCDRQEPCRNCKKRSKSCVYADDLVNARIKQLEAQVRSLGGIPGIPGDPDDTSQAKIHQASTEDLESKHGDAAIVTEAESGPQYIETPVWRAWNGKCYVPTNDSKSKIDTTVYTVDQQECSIFASIIPQSVDTSFHENHPNTENALYLWKCYFERVHPLTKLFFEPEINEIRSKCIAGDDIFTDQEHALVFAIYLITVQSLTDESCSVLGRGRFDLLKLYQSSCEQAFVAFRGFLINDIMTLRILVIYLYSVFTRNKFHHSWDAMGFVLRKAERLGLHRDGSHLKLSLYETERRRRIWWFLQHMDLGSSTVSGATSINLMSDWDTKLPLNIEDDDIAPQTDSIIERSGLTSMSHCLWRYWIISEQRSVTDVRGRRFGASWAIDSNLSLDERRGLVDKIENSLNEKYLKFCNPIKSLDFLVLLMARNLMNWYRRNLQAPGRGFKDDAEFTKEDHQSVLTYSIQTMEYDQAMFTTPCLEPYQWDWMHLFPWSSFVHLLVELTKEKDHENAVKLWDVISATYQYSPEMQFIKFDRRKIYVAGLTVDAWNHLQNIRGDKNVSTIAKPDFVSVLEQYLVDARIVKQHPKASNVEKTGQDNTRMLEQESEFFPTNFDDIDWTLWDPFTGYELLDGN